MNVINQVLTRGVANIIPNKATLKKALLSDKKLNIYLGVDTTGPRLHLGHSVPLRKLQAFADLGHHVTFLIGDFTTLVGDTSDKDAERPILTEAEIKQNFATYQKQAQKFLDFSQIQVVHNSSWLKKLEFGQIIKLAQHFSVGDFIGRELIKKRLSSGKRVRLDEVLYPLMQGYDSYHLDTDLQIGATDQTFNMQAGRTLQKHLRGKQSSVLTFDLLEGTDGRKMSKSWGNAIWLEDSPHDAYGKAMAISDRLILQYLTLATNLPSAKVNQLKSQIKTDPMDVKKLLAHTIVTELHSIKAADQAAQEFKITVQQGKVPSNIPTVTINQKQIGLVDLLEKAKLVSSRSQAKRLISQGAVELDDRQLTDPSATVTIKPGSILRAGKRNYVKLTTK